jgi:membrane protein DedA with SNARE-associated domain
VIAKSRRLFGKSCGRRHDDGASAQHLVGQYGYGAIFVIVMLESAGIPMPGETILVSAAVYAGTRHALDIRWVIAAAAGGAILGDNIGFWVGREFGEPLLEGGISSGSTPASDCWADISSPAMAG